MTNTPQGNDERKFNEALKRMLKTPPKPKRSGDNPKSHDDKEKKKPKD